MFKHAISSLRWYLNQNSQGRNAMALSTLVCALPLGYLAVTMLPK